MLLKELRESKGLSQEDLALLSGLNRGTIGALEAGSRKPYPSSRRKLARALKVRPEAIQFQRSVYRPRRLIANGP